MKKEVYEELKRLVTEIMIATDPKSAYLNLRAEKIIKLLYQEVDGVTEKDLYWNKIEVEPIKKTIVNVNIVKIKKGEPKIYLDDWNEIEVEKGGEKEE